MHHVYVLNNGRHLRWEPTTELVCSWCRQPLAENLSEAMRKANFMFDLLAKPSAISQGEYFYTHKCNAQGIQCSRGDDILQSYGVDASWGWLSIARALGRDHVFNRAFGNTQKALQKEMPPGCYEQFYAQWQPAWQRVKKPTQTSVRSPVSPAPARPPQPGHVYLIHALGTDRVKIGRSNVATVRFDHLKTASPYPLVLLRAIATKDMAGLERTMHHRYAAYRRHGEWFDLPPDVLSILLQEEFD